MNRLLFVAGLALLPCPLHAAGYGLYEQGARGLGQAGAFTARADDATSIFFNPAGLSRLDGKALLFSPNVILFKAEFAGADPSPGSGVHEQTRDKLLLPFAAYFAHGIGGKVAAGLGIYNAHGLEIDWLPSNVFFSGETFSGRYISTFARIAPVSFVPTASVAVSDRLRVGAGANLILSTVRFQRHLPAYNPLMDETVDIGTLDLKSERNFGAGFNAGVQWWPASRFKLGATWRSKVTIRYRGLADFTQRATGDPLFDAAVFATFPPDQGFTTTIPFPAQASLGVAYQSSPAWALEADVNHTWGDALDRIPIRFARTPERDVDLVEEWENALNVRVGTEYRKGGTAPWAWRAGYSFDQTPQPVESVGPLLADTDRHGITLGLGHQGAHTAIDLYGLLLLTPDRSTGGRNRDNFNGTYSTGTFAMGASLGFTFP